MYHLSTFGKELVMADTPASIICVSVSNYGTLLVRS